MGGCVWGGVKSARIGEDLNLGRLRLVIMGMEIKSANTGDKLMKKVEWGQPAQLQCDETLYIL